MELGPLELEILHLLGEMGESRPLEIHRRLQATHPVAYTTVTNTLYRLADKGLLRVRRTGPKRAYYGLSENPRARDQAAGSVVARLVRAFGADAVSRLIEEESPPRRGRRSQARERP